jgi:hypothetical protein
MKRPDLERALELIKEAQEELKEWYPQISGVLGEAVEIIEERIEYEEERGEWNGWWKGRQSGRGNVSSGYKRTGNILGVRGG